MRYLFLFCLSAMLCQPLTAQRVAGELLVELESPAALRALVARYPDWKLQPMQQLIPRFNYWLFGYDSNAVAADDLLKAIAAAPQVKMAQHNHLVSLRSPQNNTPNDPLFANQWQYVNIGANGGMPDADLDAPEAWDITTGGLTQSGEQVVIAIIDDGMDTQHPDFGNNLWINAAEIDNNNLDDDLNGYTDDYRGWNILQNNDDIGSGSAGAHGTSVAGIIGARGDNGIGVAGVNWTTKLMIIRNYANTSEANVLASYGYALTQRRIYNESSGNSGAFVVATNASWGINYGQPADAPLWCAFYDTLGKYGILNIAATANLNINVDSLGDLPTACPSDYLVAVTNVNRLGDKLYSAAYGNTSIDLGAYGESVYTTVYSSGYGTFGGTSAATPHVTGAVGLLYTGACTDFLALAKHDPQQAALLAKQWILDGTVNTSATLAASQTGGCLNLYNSLQMAINNCPTGCYPPYNFYTTNNGDSSLTLYWHLATNADNIWLRYREQGGAWVDAGFVGLDYYTIYNVSACANYEVQAVAWCNGVAGADTVSYHFTSEGCCTAPQGLGISNISNDGTLLAWTDLQAAQSYRLRWRLLGTQAWEEQNGIINTQFQLSDLAACSYYEVQLAAFCANGDSTDYSHVQSFLTDGCQSCFDVNYCTSAGQSSSNDWIQRFSFGDFNHVSGNNGGYYQCLNDFIEAQQNSSYSVSVVQGEAYLEYLRIWADWNHDGDFNDAYELAVEGTIPYVSSFTGSLFVPATAQVGNTRLRVAMQWNSNPTLCGSINYGEVEDYCLQISPNTATLAPQATTIDLRVYPNPFSDGFNLDYTLAQPLEQSVLRIFSATGQLVYSVDMNNLPAGAGHWQCNDLGHLPAGVYFLQWQNEYIKLIEN